MSAISKKNFQKPQYMGKCIGRSIVIWSRSNTNIWKKRTKVNGQIANDLS